MIIKLDKYCYSAGDSVRIIVDTEGDKPLFEEISSCKNINVSLIKIEAKRDSLSFGFGINPSISDGKIILERKLPDSFKDGLYCVSPLKLVSDDIEQSQPPKAIFPDNWNNAYFIFSQDSCSSTSTSYKQLIELRDRTYKERAAYLNAPLFTNDANAQTNYSNFRVFIFGVGCLIHSKQNAQGFIIHKIPHSFGYDHMRSAVNKYLKDSINGFQLNHEPKIEDSFNHSTPLFAIEFRNLNATSHKDASSSASLFAESIYSIMAFNKGQRPNTFAEVSINQRDMSFEQSFHFPGYYGELLGDFGTASTSVMLEKYLPKIFSSKWLNLIVKLYSEVCGELNFHTKCLKSWSILEMVAKKNVIANNQELFYANDNKITYENNVAVRTDKAKGKVYKYLFDSQLPQVNYSDGKSGIRIIFETNEDATLSSNYSNETKIVNLWDFIRSLYAIRNATAHSGEFDIVSARTGKPDERMATELLQCGNFFYSKLDAITKHVVTIELDKDIAS